MWAHEGVSSKPGDSSSQSLCRYQRVFPTPGTESPRRGCGDGFSLCHSDDVGAGLDDSEVESVTCLGRMPKVKVEKWQKVLDHYIEITLQTIIHIETSSEMKELIRIADANLETSHVWQSGGPAAGTGITAGDFDWISTYSTFWRLCSNS